MGAATSRVEIEVSEHRFIVRQNLAKFLHFLQTHDSKRWYEYVWVDQLCIDQANTVERNHQVGSMAQIYRNSSELLIWLGPASFFDKLAMPAMRFHYRVFRPEPTDVDVPSQSATRRFMRRVARFWLSVNYFSIGSVLDRTYWDRVWITQELILRNPGTIFCRHLRCDKLQLEAIFQHRLRSCGENYSVIDPIRSWDWESAEESWYLGYLDLIVAVVRFGGRQCEDPRDRIFGLVGILRDDQKPTVDYSLPYQAVYAGVCNSICCHKDEYVPIERIDEDTGKALRILAREAQKLEDLN